MPSASDFYNELKAANNRLDAIKNGVLDVKNAVDSVRDAVKDVNKTLTTGFGELTTRLDYTNQALYQNSKQNETIICILEHVSKQTCELVNLGHLQILLQTAIRKSTEQLAALYEISHGDAAVQRANHQALRAEIEKCCPPEPPRPACVYQPCEAPRPLPEPRREEERPPIR